MGKVNRREFLEDVIANREEQAVASGPDLVYKQYANKEIPKGLQKTTSTLNPYTGAWTEDEAIHLLRRTTFGVKPADVQTLLGMSMNQAVDTLLNISTTAPTPPLNNYQSVVADPTIPLGQTWVNAPYDSNTVGQRYYSFKSWWTGLMINQNMSILEKMVLFWHNHFATEVLTVGDARKSYKLNAMFRANALGNFKTLVKNVTLDPSMLVYLNGQLNTKTAPDENYGRELQELFTIGKGFTPIWDEDDVKAAAKALTGWRINNTTVTSYFDANRHDTSNKIFSSYYNYYVVVGKAGASGATEVDDLINMLFNKQDTALHICRKLYRYFVYYIIDSTVEANIIVPMAQTLVNNNFNIKPVMEELLKSEHFYDMNSRSCYIRNPLDYLIGMFRTMKIDIPTTLSVDKTYAIWNYVRSYGNSLALDLGDPPNVAGWPAYYQEPDYYETWINSNTLPKRMSFADMMLNSGFSAGTGTTIKIDVIEFAKLCPNVGDPNALIDFFVKYCLGLPLTANTKKAIKESELLSGQTSDYYWTVAWTNYASNPNTANTNTVKTRLVSTLFEILRLPEHHLC
ncbi:hypothetical protein CAP35_08040 [Chitinophagaceae bacterium IBVUCB1]|nr:hypothetical protein CAP35_08040 [Chitinophagaceae bacterium IBVUCB1]